MVEQTQKVVVEAAEEVPKTDQSKHTREEGKRTKASTAGTVKDGKLGGAWGFKKNPEFLKTRLAQFDEWLAAQNAAFAALPSEKITVTLPDGNKKEGEAFKTSPFDIAKMISKQFAEKVVVSSVRYPSGRIATLDTGLENPEAKAEKEGDGWMQWDATRPLEGNCDLKLYTFDDPEGREVFWHSSAHVLGETLEQEFGVHLCHGPPTDAGFFYDSYTGSDIFTDKSYKAIEETAKKIVTASQTFYRLVLTKKQALQLFCDNPFKVSMIDSKIAEDAKVTAYKCGDLIDLCTGPHVPSTKMIKAFKVMKNSSAYWLGNAENDSLQRVYAISYPSKKELDEYIAFKEAAEKNDHRLLGKSQKLFDNHELAPGSAFFYPHGTKVYQKLIEMIREQYRSRGYQEVITPNTFNLKLWKTSGHYSAYKENMFMFKIEGQGFGMKPMNCPGHCLMFDNQIRSYRDLPIRFADFGVLHRNEISGALSGLTRVRRFQQDDAHLFCTPEGLEDEVMGVLDFLQHVYGIFGFTFNLDLSTRPEVRLGTDAQWDEAEKALENALNKFGKPWKINPGDGAFYGPKIDIKVFDAMKRAHQCGTIQCDFQLPIRFNLQYQAEGAAEEQAHAAENKEKHKHEHNLNSQCFKPDDMDDVEFTWKEQPLKPGFKRPVIVHRAILGSVERFMAILIEHLGGKWPFWISPRQVIVLPISEKAEAYCESVYLYLHKLGFEAGIDRSQGQINKKVRNAQIAQWNYILVAGEEEMQSGTVDVRTRDTERHGKMRVDKLADMLAAMKPAPSSAHNIFYEKVWNPSAYPEQPAEAKQVTKEVKTEEVKSE